MNILLNRCQEGIQEVQKHEVGLFDASLLGEDWSLLSLENTLLNLGSLKEVSKGVFYCLAIPPQEPEENVVVR